MFDSDPGICLLLAASLFTNSVRGVEKVIIDTDFAMPPQDDSMALMLALASPELEIVGITTVAGNRSQEQANVDLLRMLEIAARTEIPVYSGADMPLVHEVSEYALAAHGEWYSNASPEMPPGGFASKKAESITAVEFLLQSSERDAGQITVIALGPLTNLAMAVRQDPKFSERIKKLLIMGGAIASLPDGGGNITPNAEFNFWVDPEAARIVLRSGIPIELSPLNVSRKTGFMKQHFEAIIRADTPLTRLLEETMGKIFQSDDGRSFLMHDQVAVASAIDPTLVEKVELYVDVDISRGINYGVSVGGEKPWPGAEGAKRMWVQFDLNWERFIDLFINRVTRGAKREERTELMFRRQDKS
jgi:inosine-uridine nucleoside N-ribohydrolase